MRKRIITGACVFMVLAGFLALRFIDTRLFDILIYFMAICSTYEMLNATKDSTSKVSKILVFSFTLVVFPISCFLHDYLIPIAIGYASIVLLVSIFFSKNSTIESIGDIVLSLVYPTVPLLCMMAINDRFGDDSLFVLLAIFLCSMLTDTMAFFIGSLLKGDKLCPTISPNKTISGAIGGIVGGLFGSFASFFILVLCDVKVLANVDKLVAILILVGLGIVLAIADEVGDLFESFIKRKVGIKDMSNLLPGHGGMLDRIDGISFATVFAYVIFSFLII